MRPISLLLALFVLLTPALRAANDSVLRAGDVFEIRLAGMPVDVVPEFANLQCTVGPEGLVNIPLIGKMRAVGLNSSQLADAIEAKFMAAKIFTRPTVMINVAQGARFVSVSGGVRAPNRLQWLADMTLSSAVGNCGGLSDFGSHKGVKLIRDGKIQGIYNLKEIEKDPSKDVKLLPGDQVIVPGG